MIQEIGEHDEIANATLLNIDFSKIPDSGPDRLQTIRDLGELFLKSLEAITLNISQNLTQNDLKALVLGIDKPTIPITLQDESKGDDGSLVKTYYKGNKNSLTLNSKGKVEECLSLSLVKSDESVVNVTGKDHMRVKIDPESGTLLQWVTLSAKSIELVGNPCQRKIEDKETIALDYRYENCWFTGNLSLDTDINVHTGTFKVATTPKKYENLNVEYNRGSVFSSAAFIGIRAIDDNGRFWQCITHHNCGRYENCFYYGTTDAPVTFVRQVAPTSNEHFFPIKGSTKQKIRKVDGEMKIRCNYRLGKVTRVFKNGESITREKNTKLVEKPLNKPKQWYVIDHDGGDLKTNFMKQGTTSWSLILISIRIQSVKFILLKD